ncbi:MAG: transposase [Bacteroidota bacterium]
MVAFQPLFDHRVFERAVVLVVGTLLAVRTRTVTAALRATGRDDARFSAYHRVLSRARWSCREAARVLLSLVVERFVPDGPVVVGLDDTIERRWGAKISARGIYRDPVRSSHGHFVKASGLRWLSLSVLAETPWAGRVWALPVLTVLAPSERYYARRGRTPKKLTDHARQAVLQLARWLPGRRLVVVADSGFAAIDLLAAVRGRVAVVTRLRLDAALYDPVPEPRPGLVGRPRKKGARQPTLAARAADPKTTWTRAVVGRWYGRSEQTVEVATGTALWYHVGKEAVPLRWVLVRVPGSRGAPKAFLCTDQEADPLAVIGWYVRRWKVEVTFAEVRRHLGVETQRQWSDLAILRTTPCLLGLFSVVALAADTLDATGGLSARQSAWYRKPTPTFSDALAAVRVELWRAAVFEGSGSGAQTAENRGAVFERMSATLAYAA